MCSSREGENPVKESIIWRGRPHFRRALLAEVTFTVLGYFMIPFAHFALTCLIGSPDPKVILRIEDISERYVVFIPVVAAFSALFSCRYLRHEYLVTKRHIFVRKGKKFDQCHLEMVRNTRVKKNFWVSIFGISLEVHLAPPLSKENARFNPVHGNFSMKFEYLEDPYMVKNIIDLWARSAKTR